MGTSDDSENSWAQHVSAETLPSVNLRISVSVPFNGVLWQRDPSMPVEVLPTDSSNHYTPFVPVTSEDVLADHKACTEALHRHAISEATTRGESAEHLPAPAFIAHFHIREEGKGGEGRQTKDLPSMQTLTDAMLTINPNALVVPDSSVKGETLERYRAAFDRFIAAVGETPPDAWNSDHHTLYQHVRQFYCDLRLTGLLVNGIAGFNDTATEELLLTLLEDLLLTLPQGDSARAAMLYETSNIRTSGALPDFVLEYHRQATAMIEAKGLTAAAEITTYPRSIEMMDILGSQGLLAANTNFILLPGFSAQFAIDSERYDAKERFFMTLAGIVEIKQRYSLHGPITISPRILPNESYDISHETVWEWIREIPERLQYAEGTLDIIVRLGNEDLPALNGAYVSNTQVVNSFLDYAREHAIPINTDHTQLVEAMRGTQDPLLNPSVTVNYDAKLALTRQERASQRTDPLELT